MKSQVKSTLNTSDSGKGSQEATWQAKLREIISAHNNLKVGLNVGLTGPATSRTRDKREDMMFNMVTILRKDLNFMIDDPASIKTKHVESLVNYWVGRNLTPETIDNKLSVLRTLCVWVGKEGMVRSIDDYSPNYRRTFVAKKKLNSVENKIANASDGTFWDAWDKVNAKDQTVAMQFLLISVFGARRAEAMTFKPLKRPDTEGCIELNENKKGSRTRTIPVNTEFKRAVIAALRNYVMAKGDWVRGTLGDPTKTDTQNVIHYKNVLSVVGITKSTLGLTGHEYRAEFTVAELERRSLLALPPGHPLSAK